MTAGPATRRPRAAGRGRRSRRRVRAAVEAQLGPQHDRALGAARAPSVRRLARQGQRRASARSRRRQRRDQDRDLRRPVAEAAVVEVVELLRDLGRLRVAELAARQRKPVVLALAGVHPVVGAFEADVVAGATPCALEVLAAAVGEPSSSRSARSAPRSVERRHHRLRVLHPGAARDHPDRRRSRRGSRERSTSSMPSSRATATACIGPAAP